MGRMSPEKQVDKLVDLVREANPSGEPELCRFAIIGHGDSWDSIFQEIGERPDVNMPGVVTGETLDLRKEKERVSVSKPLRSL